jgi:hypothetical protein
MDDVTIGNWWMMLTLCISKEWTYVGHRNIAIEDLICELGTGKNECARRANDTVRPCMQKCRKFMRRELKVHGV